MCESSQNKSGELIDSGIMSLEALFCLLLTYAFSVMIWRVVSGQMFECVMCVEFWESVNDPVKMKILCKVIGLILTEAERKGIVLEQFAKFRAMNTYLFYLFCELVKGMVLKIIKSP